MVIVANNTLTGVERKDRDMRWMAGGLASHNHYASFLRQCGLWNVIDDENVSHPGKQNFLQKLS